MRMCDLCVQSTRGYKNPRVRVQCVQTIQMTKYTSCALYAVLTYTYKVKYTLDLRRFVDCIIVLIIVVSDILTLVCETGNNPLNVSVFGDFALLS